MVKPALLAMIITVLLLALGVLKLKLGERYHLAQDPTPMQVRRQVLALEVLHDHAGGAVLQLADIRHPGDVFVAQLGGGPRLPLEAPP